MKEGNSQEAERRECWQCAELTERLGDALAASDNNHFSYRATLESLRAVEREREDLRRALGDLKSYLGQAGQDADHVFIVRQYIDPALSPGDSPLPPPKHEHMGIGFPLMSGQKQAWCRCGKAWPCAGDSPLPPLVEFAQNLAAEQKPLDPEAARILYDNLWNLYMPGDSPAHVCSPSVNACYHCDSPLPPPPCCPPGCQCYRCDPVAHKLTGELDFPHRGDSPTEPEPRAVCKCPFPYCVCDHGPTETEPPECGHACGCRQVIRSEDCDCGR